MYQIQTNVIGWVLFTPLFVLDESTHTTFPFIMHWHLYLNSLINPLFFKELAALNLHNNTHKKHKMSAFDPQNALIHIEYKCKTSIIWWQFQYFYKLMLLKCNGTCQVTFDSGSMISSSWLDSPGMHLNRFGHVLKPSSLSWGYIMTTTTLMQESHHTQHAFRVETVWFPICTLMLGAELW